MCFRLDDGRIRTLSLADPVKSSDNVPYRANSQKTSCLSHLIRALCEWRVIRPGHWEHAQIISEMGIIGS